MIRRDYQNLKSSNASTSIDTWLESWKNMESRISAAGMTSELEEICNDFQHANESVGSIQAGIIVMLRKQGKTLSELVADTSDRYCSYSPGNPSAADSNLTMTTLNGRDLTGQMTPDPKNNGRKCVCGQTHKYKNC